MGVIITHFNQEKRSIDHFLDHKIVTSIGSNFPDLIERFHFEIHLKDAQTGQYILSNAHNDVLHKGIDNLQSPADLIGLTADDLHAFQCYIPPDVRQRKRLKINSDVESCAYTAAIKKLDFDVLNRSAAVQQQFICFRQEGLIDLFNLIKCPIFSSDKRKIVAILSYAQDVTAQYSLFSLLQMYQKYYFDEQAIELLLKHVKIDPYFLKPPTLRELQILLAMHQHASRKRVARLLNISSNTVASHLQHLKEYKLIKPDFEEVLTQLRKVPMDREWAQ